MAYARATGGWGSASILEVLVDATQPRGQAGCGFWWRKCCDIRKGQTMLDDLNDAASLWPGLEREVAETTRQSIVMLQKELASMTRYYCRLGTVSF